MERKHRSTDRVPTNGNKVRGDASPFDFAGFDGIATTAEKNAAERGAAARGTYGAKRDRCKRGKSCGAACIFYRKDCVLDLPETVSKSVTSVRNYLLSEMRRGNINERDAQRRFLQATGLDKVKDKRENLDKERIGAVTRLKVKDSVRDAVKGRREMIKEGLSLMEKEGISKKDRGRLLREHVSDSFKHTYGIKDGGRPPKEWFDEVFSPKQQAHIQRMAEIEEKLIAGKLTPQQYQAQMKQAREEGQPRRKITDGEVLLGLAAASPQTSNYLVNAGKVSSPNIYDSRFPSTDAIPTGSGVAKSTEEKSRWAFSNMREIMETKYIDVYSGTRIRALGVDLEHLVAESNSKQFGVANVGANKSFTNSWANQQKRDDPISFFLRNNPNGLSKGLEFDANGKVTQSSYDAKFAGAEAKGSFKDMIKNKQVSAAQAIATIAAIPTKELSGPARAGLMAEIVRTYTGAAGGASLGDGKQRGEVRFKWFGEKDQGWPAAKAKNLGSQMADAIGRWEKQGNEGAQKIAALGAQINNIQRQILAINNMEFNGVPIRNTKVAGGARTFVNEQVTKILEREEPTLMAMLN